MFGRATVTSGIGPHSSYVSFCSLVLKVFKPDGWHFYDDSIYNSNQEEACAVYVYITVVLAGRMLNRNDLCLKTGTL